MSAGIPIEDIRLGVVMLCHNEPIIAARMARAWATGGAAVAIHAAQNSVSLAKK